MSIISERVSPCRCLIGEIEAPADKSISHRTAIFGSIAEGTTRVSNFLRADDCFSTLNAMRMLGVKIVENGSGTVEIHGKGLYGLQQPNGIIDCGNSGTTMRLLMGLLAAQKFSSCLTGDQYLRKRPMDRVILPLRKMGACIRGQSGDRLAPIEIEGSRLHSIEYDSPIASAQVKSAVLLAGLYCDGTTLIREPQKSRDHTERMLHQFGACIRVDELSACVEGPARLTGQMTTVPNDISSAAFFLAAAAMLPGSDLLVKNIGMNPTRAGFLEVLKRMGADISGAEFKDSGLSEPAGDIRIRGNRKLKAVHVSAPEIPALIDEIPVLAVLALCAEGATIIEGARELRVKETDRINAIARNLEVLGASVTEKPDGLMINGPQRLRGGRVDSFGDHRIAMAMAVAALIAETEVEIVDTACISTSFPSFFNTLDRVRAR